MALRDSLGLEAPTRGREDLAAYRTAQADTSQAIQTQKLLADFIEESRDFGNEPLKAAYESALAKSTSPGGIDPIKLTEQILRVIGDPRTSEGEPIKLEEGSDEIAARNALIDALKDLNVSTQLEKASIDLNNRLLDRQKLVASQGRMTKMSSDEVKLFKNFTLVQEDSRPGCFG